MMYVGVASLGQTCLGVSKLPGLLGILFPLPDWGSSPSLFFQISFQFLALPLLLVPLWARSYFWTTSGQITFLSLLTPRTQARLLSLVDCIEPKIKDHMFPNFLWTPNAQYLFKNYLLAWVPQLPCLLYFNVWLFSWSERGLSREIELNNFLNSQRICA